MYKMEVRVCFSDIGSDHKLRLYELPKYFQDVSIQHSESVDVGIPYLTERNLAWLLTSWQIGIRRRPVYDERLVIWTWPYEFKSAFGYRNYTMETDAGELLARGQAIWLHTDIAEMKPVRTPEDEAGRYGCDPKLEMDYQPRKIALPEQMRDVDTLTVPTHYADMYQHMNNAMYVDLASDYLPRDREVRQMRVDYRQQVKIGDEMIIKQGWMDDCCYIAFFDTAGELHVGTEFQLA